MLSRENQKIILPYLRHEKNTWDVAEELQVPFETAKKRIYRIRKQIVTGLLDEFVEKL
jgi:DNA-directed RNA polymerase specialized sigma24 family protein